jgi:hypothetical protein
MINKKINAENAKDQIFASTININKCAKCAVLQPAIVVKKHMQENNL